MSTDPEVIVFGKETSIQRAKLCMPVPFRCVSDANLLEGQLRSELIQTERNSKSFFILLLDSIDGNNNRLLNEMKANRRVKAIFICWDRNDVAANNESKLFHITEQLITVAITSSIIKFLKLKSENEWELSHESENEVKLHHASLARIYFEQAKTIEGWFNTHLKADPCHALIIPLNTTRDNLVNAQTCLHDICREIGISSPIIRTLDDYTRPNNDYQNWPYGQLLFEYKEHDFICELIRLLSPIRMYLIGNETCIESEWSQWMIARELKNDHDNGTNFSNQCTLIKYEPINDEMQWNFRWMFANTWQVTPKKPIDLASVQFNCQFQSAVHEADIFLDTREIAVRAKVLKWANNNTIFRREFPMITQATGVNRRRDKNEQDPNSQIRWPD